jgi:hypothetical protein
MGKQLLYHVSGYVEREFARRLERNLPLAFYFLGWTRFALWDSGILIYNYPFFLLRLMPTSYMLVFTSTICKHILVGSACSAPVVELSKQYNGNTSN